MEELIDLGRRLDRYGPDGSSYSATMAGHIAKEAVKFYIAQLEILDKKQITPELLKFLESLD